MEYFAPILVILVLAMRTVGIEGWMRIFAVLRPLPKEQLAAIEKYNTFYQKLPPKSKSIFLRKVKQFNFTKTYIPRHMPEVSDEMKGMIASAAVQLTFGLPAIVLEHFERILVYPDQYYSLINRMYHKGEVNPRFKIIVLSWRAFVEGFANPHDGINLGLHEMAHALKLENIIDNDEYNFFDRKEYAKWQAIANAETPKIRQGEESLFRPYAGTNEDEFFAIGIELYFEKPQELFDYNTELYQVLSNLLRQDTLRLVG